MTFSHHALFFRSWMIGALILHASIARSEPMAVQCQIADIPIAFDSIDLLSRTPQPGTGNVIVHCSNASSRTLRLTLSAAPDGGGENNREWELRQHGITAMGLKVFADPQRRQSLGVSSDPNRSLTHQQLIDGHSKITIFMPFFTQLTLSGIPAGGMHRSPADFRLTYRSERLANTD